MRIIKNFLTVIIIAFFLSIALRKVLAVSKTIFIYQNNGVDANIRYDITISDEDIAAAQSLDQSCLISTWTLNTGYGRNDNEASNFDSVGNTSNAEKPITRHKNIFSEQNGYDIMHSNGFDRVMPVISFFGENQSCEIRYPIAAKPILFSDFPYIYPAVPAPTL